MMMKRRSPVKQKNWRLLELEANTSKPEAMERRYSDVPSPYSPRSAAKVVPLLSPKKKETPARVSDSGGGRVPGGGAPPATAW